MQNWLPILTFHALDGGKEAIAFSPQAFVRALEKLHSWGYRTVPLSGVPDLLDRGDGFPERTVVITFDDGYRSVYEVACPTLARFGMTATVFVSVGAEPRRGEEDRFPSLCGREMLNWREARAMRSAGMEIGGHTLSHPDLTRLARDDAEREMGDAKAQIEGELGVEVASFAYPFGRHDPQTRSLAQDLFRCACSDRLGVVTTGADPLVLPRVDTYYLQWERWFDLLPTPLLPLYVRARSVPRGLRRSLQGRSG